MTKAPKPSPDHGAVRQKPRNITDPDGPAYSAPDAAKRTAEQDRAKP